MIVSNGQNLGFAPQALGETTPNLANGYYYAETGLTLLGKFATYAALYRAQPSIATLVDKIAASAARLTVKVWDNTPASGRVQDTASAFAKLMADPCVSMSPFNFWRWTFSTYEIYGEAFWLKVRDSFGTIIAFLPMHPSRTAVKRDGATGAVSYIFTLGVGSAGILTVDSMEVVAFQRYNPDSLMRGLSRLEPLRSTLRNEDAARRAMDSFWKRGARPSVILKHPGELSQGASDRLKASFDARHSGADNMGSSSVLEEGMDAQIIQLNAEEMQYIESRKMNLQEACMVYDVPPPVVHILDHATFSNITEQMKSLYRDTMTPRLVDHESVIDHSVRAEFFPIGERRAEFSMDEILRGDPDTWANTQTQLRQGGVTTGNESRVSLGLSRIEDPEMDKVYANAALVPLGAKTDAAVATDGTLIPQQLGAASTNGPKALTVRSIMGRLARVKANKADLRKALVTEHATQIAKFLGEQKSAVKASAGKKDAGGFNPKAWDGQLASILLALSKATTQAIGSSTADDLDGKYDPARLEDWLTQESSTSAQNINKTTADQIAAAFLAAQDSEEDPEDTVDVVFDGAISARGNQIADTRVAMLGGLAAIVAAEQSDARTKTWVTTAANPRPAHASMDGETVGLNEPFSNGMNGPGDFSGGADEVAGCTCDLQFSKEG